MENNSTTQANMWERLQPFCTQIPWLGLIAQCTSKTVTVLLRATFFRFAILLNFRQFSFKYLYFIISSLQIFSIISSSISQNMGLSNTFHNPSVIFPLKKKILYLSQYLKPENISDFNTEVHISPSLWKPFKFGLVTRFWNHFFGSDWH